MYLWTVVPRMSLYIEFNNLNILNEFCLTRDRKISNVYLLMDIEVIGNN